ncbi:Type IV pilus biogenesis protein PilF [hydrothermal vent metagenome]|uniref:Type IV pilus biogenesis protein PilF n=1 Tax=hydrothermal vent metagenome TaxID=652676 RepID=A0A3B1C1A5_9ZZZZ
MVLLLGAAIQVLLSACTPGNVRTGDEMGELGQYSQTSKASEIYSKLAVAYMQEGRLDIAMQKIKRGLAISPNNPKANNIIALIYERLGEHETAEKHYKRAVKLDPKDPYTHNAYGSFLCSRERYDEADRQFADALKNPLYQTPEVALTNAGLCAGRHGNQVQAEDYFRQALKKNAKFPVALNRMANISLEKNNYLSARGYLHRYLEVTRHTAHSLWLGIRVERTLKDLDALASYEMLLRAEFPDSAEMRMYEESKK